MNSLTRKQKANAIRALSMDAVERANSGHPGAPMGMADIAEVLWNSFLKHNPSNPQWFNRDRFILSNGHASMLLYSLLHLTGYDLTIDDLKNFRQFNSKTPGHPEYGYTPGVETTTGPLGQGFANAVGFALAEKLMAEKYNKPEYHIINNRTWVFLGDGCLMEGISHEAASFAGTLGLSRLIAIYDDNNISIDGQVTAWFRDNTAERFRSYGWHVIDNVDGHDSEQIHQALQKAVEYSEKDDAKPTIICCRTSIGFGSPNKQNTADAHGSPLGKAEIKLSRETLDWNYEPFDIPNDYYKAWDFTDKGIRLEQHWNELFVKYEQAYPDLAKEYLRRMQGELPDNWLQLTNDYIYSLQSTQNQDDKGSATRKTSQAVLSQIGPGLSELFGGSADLTGSNGTLWKDCVVINDFNKNRFNWQGQYLHYGVREFGMSAITNGMALYGGFIPYSGTFLTFLDYARNAVRMSALMKIRNIFVYTHDSIGLGEDGPTHQPIEHLAMLRATPNIDCWRPCDSVETAVAWQQAIMSKNNPSAIVLTRQNTQAQIREPKSIENIQKGGYILSDFNLSLSKQDKNTKIINLVFIATGSEVELAMAVKQELINNSDDYNVRVVSMPCVDKFKQQNKDYQNTVLAREKLCNTIIIETGCSQGWHEFININNSGDKIIAIDNTYGESAPAGELFKHFGFTVDNIIKKISE